MPKAFFSYFGGKSRLPPTILPLIPPHTVYGEVFAGAAWVLFGKEPSKVEAISRRHKGEASSASPLYFRTVNLESHLPDKTSFKAIPYLGINPKII